MSSRSEADCEEAELDAPPGCHSSLPPGKGRTRSEVRRRNRPELLRPLFGASLAVFCEMVSCGALAAPAGYPAGRQSRTVYVMPSGGDDTASLQAAIDASAPGDTVYFIPGDFHLSAVTLKSGVTYRGATGVVLYGSGTDPMITVDANDSHDIAIDALTFVGTGADPTRGAIALFGSSAANSVNHIRVTNSIFENNGITFDFLKNSRMIENRFVNVGAPGTAIHGHHLDNSTIAGNSFTNVYQGIGLVFGGAPDQGRNVVVIDNAGNGISRMGIEIIGQDPAYRGETTNLLVRGNHFTNWRHPVADGSTMGYSIVTDGGIGTQVLDNYARGDHNAGYGIELAGTGAVAMRNYLDGFSTGIIGYSSADVIENNNIIHYTSAQISTYNRSDEIVQNNTSDPTLAPPPAPRRATPQ